MTDSCTLTDHPMSIWEIEVNRTGDLTYSLEEQSIIQHFKDNNIRTDSGRFAGTFLRKSDTKAIEEYRSQAVRRFFTLKCSLLTKD